ncbi:Gustatory receptor 105f, partial [Halyomorpha halys]
MMAGLMLHDIFYFSRFLGLFPLNSNSVLSKKWLVYATLFQLSNITVGCFSLITTIHFSTGMEKRYEKVFHSIDAFDRVFAYFRQLFIVVYFVRRRNSIFLLFNKINEVISNHGNFLNYRFCFTRNCLLFIACLELSPIILIGSHSITLIINALVLFINFSSTASIVGQVWNLMQVLTKLLHDNSYECDECSIDELEHLSTIGESIDEIYGPLLLMVIVSSLPRLIMDLYIVLMQFFSDWFVMNLIILLSALLGFFLVYIIAHSYSEFLNQIDEFNNKLLWKMLNDKTGRYIENEKFNFHFTAYKAIKFTACGFFNMDYSLISSMISVCTTYLVIVLQYGKSS